MSSSLQAGDVFGAYQGYYLTIGFGTLSPDAFGGFTCTTLVTGATPGSISAEFSGDATAFLAGKAISVNGTAYPTITSGPTYSSGSNTTNIEWAYGPGNFNTTPGSNTYTIDIGAGGGGPSYAGPTWVGITTAVANAGASSINFSTLTGLAAGDSLYALAMTANQSIVIGDSDWEEVVPSSGSAFRGTAGAAGGVRATLYRKKTPATGSETTVAFTDSGDVNYVVGFAVRGDGGYLVDIDFCIANNAAASTSISMSGGTTSDDDRLALLLLATDRDSAGPTFSSPSNASLANITERFDAGTTTNTGGGLCILTGEKQAAGATGTTTMTGAASSAYGYLSLAVAHGSAPAGQSVSPSDGAILVSGDQPSVARTANQWVSPSVGHLAVGGHVPAVAQPVDQTVEPSAGALFITGDQPAVAQTAHQWVAPAKGMIAATGHVPSIGQTRNQWTEAASGSVSVSGSQPTVDRTANQSVAAAAGNLHIAGNQPVVSQADNVTVQPFSGSVFVSGYSPTVLRTANVTVAPGAGALRTTGYSPTINQTQHRFSAPVAGSMLIYGYQPSVTRNITTAVRPSHGSIYYRGQQPSVARAVDTYVAAARGRIIINGRQPSVGEPDIIVGGLPGIRLRLGGLERLGL